jgi:hypothetical protein
MKKSSMLYVLVPLAFVVFTIAGCGEIKTTSYFTPTKTKLKEFQAVQFENFETEIDDFPKEALAKIPAESAALLDSKNKFKEVSNTEITNIPASDTVIILGEVAEFRPSSDVSYEGGGIKFGEVSITIKLALLDKATGNEIATGEINGFSSMGFMAKDIYESMAKEIVKYILEIY